MFGVGWGGRWKRNFDPGDWISSRNMMVARNTKDASQVGLELRLRGVLMIKTDDAEGWPA